MPCSFPAARVRLKRHHCRLGSGLAVALVLANVAAAQPAYRVRHLDAAAGLTHDDFNATFGSDTRGFDWIGSLHGAYRFDGQDLRHYPLDEGGGLGSVQSDFHEDRRGDIWFSTTDALHRYVSGDERTVRYDVSEGRAATATGLHLAAYDRETDRLWLSDGEALWSVPAADPGPRHTASPHADVAAVRFVRLPTGDPGARRFLALPWKLSPGVRVVTFDRDRPAEVSTSRDPRLATVTVSAAAVAGDGLAYLATSAGLIAYDAAADTAAAPRLPPGDNLRPTVWDVVAVDSLLLVASERSGLWWYSPARGRFLTPVSTPYGRPAGGPSPRAVHVSPGGVLFAMQKDGGVDVYLPSGGGARIVKTSEGAPVGARVMAITRDGGARIVDDAGRMALVSPDGLARRITPRDLNGKALAPGRLADARLAGGGTDPLYLAIGREVYRASPRGAAAQYAHVATVDAAVASILFAGQATPLLYLEDERFVRPTARPASPIDGRAFPRQTPPPVFDLGAPWLARYARSGDIELLRASSDGLPVVSERFAAGMGVWSVARLAADQGASTATAMPAGALLVGGDNGVVEAAYRSDGEGWTLSPPVFPDRDFYALVPDGSGGAWALTSRGLGYRDRLGEWTFWTEADGIPGDLDYRSRLALSADSLVWIATRDRVVAFPVASQTSGLPPGRLRVSTVWVDGLPVDLPAGAGLAPAGNDGRGAAAKLDLPHRHEAVALRLATVGIYDETPATIRYRVGGLRERWRAAGPDGVVELDRLPPGSYRLEGYAVDVRGRSTPTLSLEIEVVPPYWQTPGFIAALAALLLGAVAGVAYGISRRKLVREREAFERQAILFRERDRVARELHDDLGGTLANILFLSDEDGGDEGDSGDAAALPQIATLSRSALANIREIIWALDETGGGLAAFVERVGDQARELCAARDIRCEVVAPPVYAADLPELGGTIRKELSLLIKEAVSNAVKHSGAGCVVISFRESGPTVLHVVIEDDGRGFDPDRVIEGMGTGNMKHRAEKAGGTVDIASEPGRGTTVRIEIPLA